MVCLGKLCIPKSLFLECFRYDYKFSKPAIYSEIISLV